MNIHVSDYIQNTSYYIYTKTTIVNPIYIGYGIDNNYARCLATSITSFCLNNPNQFFSFHIMANNISSDTKQNLDLLAKQLSTNITIYEINTSYLKNFPTKTHLPISTYFRLILPLILNNINKLLYIDADIICLKEASELFNIKLDNNIIGAVPDLKWMNDKRNKALKLKKHTYFNAGMLVINVPAWNKFNVFDKVYKIISENHFTFEYLDQDILNLILTKKITYLTTKFNCIDINNINHQDIILLHFAAHPKPWNIAFPISKTCNKFTKNLYLYYEKQTPWKNVPLDLPRNYKEYKIYAKALKYNKQYIKSLKWFIKYFIKKFNM